MNNRRFILVLAGVLTAGCRATPVTPSQAEITTLSPAAVVGKMAVDFLNRFSASTVPPEACLLDFADSCRGKADELSDIRSNRDHFEILGARLGVPSVQFESNGAVAHIAMSCAFDSRIVMCDGPGCTVGSTDHVTGTCTLDSIFQGTRWWLCTSRFAGSGFTSPAAMKAFFGSSAR